MEKIPKRWRDNPLLFGETLLERTEEVGWPFSVLAEMLKGAHYCHSWSDKLWVTPSSPDYFEECGCVDEVDSDIREEKIQDWISNTKALSHISSEQRAAIVRRCMVIEIGRLADVLRVHLQLQARGHYCACYRGSPWRYKGMYNFGNCTCKGFDRREIRKKIQERG